MQKRTLIIGGGVAGICLAHQLTQRNEAFNLVDDGKNVSSVVAAGIVHAMSFRRTLLSWNAMPFYKESEAFYKAVERTLNTKFFNPLIVRRLFSSPEETLIWKQRMTDSAFQPFLREYSEEDERFGPYGSGCVDGFWIDSKAFISESLHDLSARKLLLTDTITVDNFNPNTLEYKGIQYDAVVLALGYKSKETPWFLSVPVNPTKGQLLTVKWENPIQNTSLHRKAFALPIGGNAFKLGSTYEWNDISTEPTEEGKERILNNATSITADPLEVIDHTAGIRPTTPDRRPVLARHMTHKQLFIFNGLGSKGYMLAPSLAKQLSEAIIDNKPLSEELNPSRFNS
jgi:glycine/D-amino acid oxidase-like deaminating enzyme